MDVIMVTAERPRGERGEGAVTFDKSVGLWTARLDLGRNAAGKDRGQDVMTAVRALLEDRPDV